jgi:predicted RNase H-like nuclease (RuvC/YqgF family)
MRVRDSTFAEPCFDKIRGEVLHGNCPTVAWTREDSHTAAVMATLKQLKEAEKNAVKQLQVIEELNSLVKDIERCEKSIVDLRNELEAVNQKHAARKTTREDIAYLEDLLKCANKKLTWEKHMASLKKRTPELLERITKLMNDPEAPPSDAIRAGMLQALQGVSAAMERLEKVKVE